MSTIVLLPGLETESMLMLCIFLSLPLELVSNLSTLVLLMCPPRYSSLWSLSGERVFYLRIYYFFVDDYDFVLCS
jgi:hypothetical protein